MDKQKLLIIVAIVVIILIIVLAFGLKEDRGKKSVVLEFWGVYDEPTLYSGFIEAYSKENKHVTIKYQKKSFDTYEKDLVDALAAGQGPDIWIIHNTWLPKHKDKISPVPQTEEFTSLKIFENTFIDVVYQDFVDDNEIYAIPLYVDTLALYYNKDLLNSAGIPSPPATWTEFLTDVELLTQRDQWGNIQKSGVAMGTAENINRSTDVLTLLLLQTGAEMTDEKHVQATFHQSTYLEGKPFSPGKEALRFYTDFSNPTKRVYCWNKQMPYSIDAFYQGKTAMMINYSHHIETIRSKVPYLNFAIAPVPQIEGRDFDINYPNYWALTVSKGSKASEEAWRFILFLRQKENARQYVELAKKPTSRRDLVEWQREDADLGVFADQALSARSWYQADSQAIEKIFANMVESIVLGEALIEQAIAKAADQVTILMRK